MDLGIGLPNVGPAAEREFLLQLARAAEDLGFASVWVQDHVVMPAERTSEYPYPASGSEVLMTAGVDWLDPIATMGVLAGATERVGIGTSVLVLPYRNPVVLANELATLDRLSEGRIALGIGSGWMDEEFAAVGVPKRERGARTDEAIAVLKTLWSRPDPVSFEGRFWSFRGVQLASRPFQPGGPPILVGGNTEPALRRAGRLGDGWLGFDVFPEQMGEAVTTIRRHAEEAGRSPDDVVLTVRRGLLPPFEVGNFLPARRCLGPTTREVLAELRTYAAAGVGAVALDFAMIPPEMVRAMEWVAREVLPEASGL